jgi:hypothetical protein
MPYTEGRFLVRMGCKYYDVKDQKAQVLDFSPKSYALLHTVREQMVRKGRNTDEINNHLLRFFQQNIQEKN